MSSYNNYTVVRCIPLSCELCSINRKIAIYENIDLLKNIKNPVDLGECSSTQYNGYFKKINKHKQLQAIDIMRYCLLKPDQGEEICSSFNPRISDQDIYNYILKDPLNNCL